MVKFDGCSATCRNNTMYSTFIVYVGNEYNVFKQLVFHWNFKQELHTKYTQKDSILPPLNKDFNTENNNDALIPLLNLHQWASVSSNLSNAESIAIYPFKTSRCIKASFYIPENTLDFPTTRGFKMKTPMKLVY